MTRRKAHISGSIKSISENTPPRVYMSIRPSSAQPPWADSVRGGGGGYMGKVGSVDESAEKSGSLDETQMSSTV